MENIGLEKSQENTVAVVVEETGIVVSEQTAELILNSLAEKTQESYRVRLKAFAKWLNGREITDQLLAEYLTFLFHEGYSPSSIKNSCAAVKWFLKQRTKKSKIEFPITTITLAGINRQGRDRGIGQRNALTWEQVERICAVQESDGTLQGLRNSAIFRVMSDCLMRASELIEIKVSDLEGDGVVIRFSKTDQAGKGTHQHLCSDTRRILHQWLEGAGITKGYIFRPLTGRGDRLLYTNKNTKLGYDALRAIIKRCAERVGISEKISTHSLRIGTAVSLVQRGATLPELQVEGRWESPNMPAHYARAQLSKRGAIARLKDGVE